MEVVGSEIGHKMRSAIKAKLTELGCYVDDELPDYVMVMVANKRTREQMEEDLQLFLGDNTELFVNWLHQVLRKLQEVTVPPPKAPEPEKVKEKPKEKKVKKDKLKTKDKKTNTKKAKKKEKEKSRKKGEKKAHKSKKKSKKHEMIRPNIPPLLMNIEKESEPSITDVFAGQILKNHGITIDMNEKLGSKNQDVDKKPDILDKRLLLPVIDPATISAQPEADNTPTQTDTRPVGIDKPVASSAAPREEQIREMTEIEAKIQGLKQKLAEQLDSMSEDEDFLNIRTEAEELMNDFAEDVFQEISQAPAEAAEPIIPAPPPISPKPAEVQIEPTSPEKTPSEVPEIPEIAPEDTPSEPPKVPKETPRELPETIELKLPKRPVRERLGAREEALRLLERTKLPDRKKPSPERFTPEPEPDFWGKTKSSARSRLGSQPERKRLSLSSDSDKSDGGRKRVLSSSSRRRDRSRSRTRAKCASVVVVKPRMRAKTSSLLLRAVADAHKSLLNIPPKVDHEPHKVKRALVLPMRRMDPQNIVIQVPRDTRPDKSRDTRPDAGSDGDDKTAKLTMYTDQGAEYVPVPLSRKFTNTDYVPSRQDRAAREDETLIIETINIHNTKVVKDRDTKFIVTMDGFSPNAFLAKKLQTEGLLNDEEELQEKTKTTSVLKTKNSEETLATAVTTENETAEKQDDVEEYVPESVDRKKKSEPIAKKVESKKGKEPQKMPSHVPKETEVEVLKPTSRSPQRKRVSDTSEDSDTQVIIKQERDYSHNVAEKRKTDAMMSQGEPAVKKRKASPIVFDVAKKEKERQKEKEIRKERETNNEKERETQNEVKRERTESASSDNHVTVTTTLNTNKYDTLPPLSAAERKLVWCRAFPLCRYGAACAFQHPRCKFAAGCTRRNCPYSHDLGPRPAMPALPVPVVASHVVPVANYKTITPGVLPSICRFYPNCTNAACRFFHPKPCRFGSGCINKLECNFYHDDSKFNYPV